MVYTCVHLEVNQPLFVEQENMCTTREIQWMMQLSWCPFVDDQLTSPVELDVISWEKNGRFLFTRQNNATYYFIIVSCEGTIYARNWPWNQIGSYRVETKGWDGQGRWLPCDIQVDHPSHDFTFCFAFVTTVGVLFLICICTKISILHIMDISSLYKHGMYSLLNS